MAIREGRWDCPSCGSKAIYGRHMECPGCGKPRPAGVRFYLTDNAPAITDAAQLAEARAGADWICLHCAATNRATVESCTGCGAARGSSPTQPVGTYPLGQVPRSGEAPAGARFAVSTATAAPPKIPPATNVTPFINRMLAGFFLLICALVGGAFYAGVRGQQAARALSDRVWAAPPVEPAVITGRGWERRVVLQERRLVPGAGAVLPESALVLTTTRRQTGTRRVVDHYVTSTRTVPRTVSTVVGYDTRTRQVTEEVSSGSRTYVCGQRDLGNGYFEDVECSEPTYTTRTRTETYREPRYRTETIHETVTDRTPVYRTEPVYTSWYTWNQPVWTDSLLVATGDTTAPAWPEVSLNANRRETERVERYFIMLKRPVDSAPWEQDLEVEDWNRLRIGQRVAVRVRGYGSIEFLPRDSLPECIAWRTGQAPNPWPDSLAPAPPDSLGCSPPLAEAVPADSTSADSTAQDSIPGDSTSPDAAK